ncbi:flippase [Mongoliitalea daihaiensis]|uniref:flippase n=1 Tax=Mongoliitalea daihaiensis TaxID=2782006 RepID=UPI001F1B134B|nr:flippase [Mongoliitalea daihaiensis]UJP63381.1 flippase [Mongoliitalea daihaiensis]
MRSFLRDTLSVGFSNILIILFNLGVSIVTARYLGPEGNGTIAGLLVYPSIFMAIGSLGVRQSTTYILGRKLFSEEQIKRAISQIWFVSSVFSIVICLLLILNFSKSGTNIYWVTFALIPIPFSLFNTYNSGIFLGKNNIKFFNKINWFPPALVFMGTLFLVVLFQWGISGALIAKIIGPLFLFFILLFKNDFIKCFSFNIEVDVLSKLVSLGLIYAFSLLVINLNYKVDVILLDKISNTYELGIYSKGAGIIEYLWQIPMVFSSIVFARSSVAKDSSSFSNQVAQLLRVSLILIGGASVALLLLSKYIILGMYGQEFFESISVLKFLLPGVLILTIYKVMNMDLAGRGKPWISMKAMIPALVINVLLNIILIPKYGADGAAIASTISYSFAGLLFLWFYSKEVKIGIKEILKFKKSDFDPLKRVISKFV